MLDCNREPLHHTKLYFLILGASYKVVDTFMKHMYFMNINLTKWVYVAVAVIISNSPFYPFHHVCLDDLEHQFFPIPNTNK